MSDKMRWRYGDTNPVVAAVDSTTVIEYGDLLWQDVDDVKPASDLDLSGFSNPAQEQFAGQFLGVAMQCSHDGDTLPIRVATTGVFKFDCPSGTFELGDMIGVYALQASGGSDCKYLQSQMVVKVHNSQYAIGRVAKYEKGTTVNVLVDIHSKVMGPL